MTLKYRIFPLYSISLLVAVLAIFLPSWHMMKQSRLDQARRDLTDILSATKQGIAADAEKRDTESIARKLEILAKSVSARITLIEDDGDVVFDSDANPAEMLRHNDRPEIIGALEKGHGESYRFSTTLKKHFLYSATRMTTASGQNLFLRISQSEDVIFKGMEDSVQSLLAFCVIAFIAGFLINLLVSAKINTPLSEIRELAANFANGKFSRTIHPCGIHEIDTISSQIDKMAAEFKESMEKEKRGGRELNAILSSMKEGVIAVDADGRLIQANTAAMRLFNISEKGLADRRFFQELIRNTDVQRLLEELLSNNSDIEREIEVFGTKKTHLQVRGTALLSQEGKSIGALVVLNDMSRMKKLEDMRKDFVANVSHEIRTPLTAIVGAVETMLENNLGGKERNRMLEILAKHSQRLNVLVEDILSLSKIEQGIDELDFTYSSAAQMVEGAVDACREKADEKNITIKMDIEDFELNMDQGLFQQAVINLIDNAVKYSGKGEVVRVKTRKSDESFDISVSDDGCGIPQEHIPRIFERFYRVDKARSRELGGTGLGLSIVKYVVSAHGGEVIVDSTPGKGSTFTIRIPRG